MTGFLWEFVINDMFPMETVINDRFSVINDRFPVWKLPSMTGFIWETVINDMFPIKTVINDRFSMGIRHQWQVSYGEL